MRLILALLALLSPLAANAAPLPRTAIISAFAPEMVLLEATLTERREKTIGGVRFVSGDLDGRPVLLFLSGMSMINAAMTTQLAIDHFPIRRIVFSGIAGGIDPALDVGDVVVPAAWAHYMESVFARAEGGGFVPPPPYDDRQLLANQGFIFPRAGTLQRAGQPAIESKLWFDADPTMLDAARRAAAKVVLARCVEALCLAAQPRIVVGGHGVSAPVFMDNAEVRAWLFGTFAAQATDMETAAVAHVAYVHGVPFIAFRSLSDLAGADPAQNQARVFFRLASDNAAMVVRAFLQELDK
ncbi:MAG: 5'-methylthioadenosine/S-adenosylhomocysteine nucleosidase [Rhizorhabdus sp.]